MNQYVIWFLTGGMVGAGHLYSLVRSTRTSPMASCAAAPIRLLLVAACLFTAAWLGHLLPTVIGWAVTLGVGSPLVLKVVSWK